MTLTVMIALLCVGGPAVVVRADSTQDSAKTELLPILSYDTDAGFGYGLKMFALNYLGNDESFDLTLFNSTNNLGTFFVSIKSTTR